MLPEPFSTSATFILVPSSFKLQKPNFKLSVNQNPISLAFSTDSELKYDNKLVGLQ